MPDGDDLRVLVEDRQDRSVDVDTLVDLARTVLRGEGVADAELSLAFVSEDEIAALHERFLGEPGPTDVLAFPLGEADGDGTRLLGDVVIAPAYAARTRDDLDAELRLLLVHGILHLLGHDHEDDAERAAMWTLQARYSGVTIP
jgi:probable rRNA maturation factor